MATRERQVMRATAFKGQKSAYPLESYGIDSAEEIQNFYLRNNQLNKVNGNSLYAEIYTAETGGVTSLHAFKDLLFAQRTTSLGFFLVANANTILDLPAGLTIPQRLFSTSWRDRIVFTNTRDATMFYYPTTTGIGSSSIKNFGVDPPATALPSGFTDEGSSSGNCDVYNAYMITLYDADTNSESPCAGALPSMNGLYELSPNGTISQPFVTTYQANTSSKIHLSYASLAPYLIAAQAASPRATHFVIYKAASAAAPGQPDSYLIGTPPLYIPFFRVPNVNNNSQVLNNIFEFLGAHNDFVDNNAYNSLVAISPPTNNSPPPLPSRLLASLTAAKASVSAPETWQLSDYSGFRHIRFFRDQMFGVGSHSYGFTATKDIVISSNTNQRLVGVVTQYKDLLHGSEVFQPDYWPYVWEIGVGDGQETVGLGVLGDVALFIFKEGSAYYLAGSSPDSFVVRIMDLQKGCVHQGMIQETPAGVITLDRGGFVLWDKIGQGTRISDDVFDVIQTIDFTNCSNFYSSFDPYKNIYKCSVTLTGSEFTTPNYTFIMDLTTTQWSFEMGQEGLSRINFSLNSNNFSTAHGVVVNIGRFYDFVGSATTGRILDCSSPVNVTNQGQAIVGVWKSGTVNFGEDQHKKQMTWIYLRAKSQNPWTINIDVIPDYDESRTYSVANWSPVSSNSLWYSSSISTDGSLIWDDGSGTVGGNWASAGDTRFVSKIPVKCIGYSFQIRITHQSTDPAQYEFAIESVSAEAKALGR